MNLFLFRLKEKDKGRQLRQVFGQISIVIQSFPPSRVRSSHSLIPCTSTDAHLVDAYFLDKFDRIYAEPSGAPDAVVHIDLDRIGTPMWEVTA
jgi:hypothetical protein